MVDVIREGGEWQEVTVWGYEIGEGTGSFSGSWESVSHGKAYHQGVFNYGQSSVSDHNPTLRIGTGGGVGWGREGNLCGNSGKTWVGSAWG